MQNAQDINVLAGADRVERFVQVGIGYGRWAPPWLTVSGQPTFTLWSPLNGGQGTSPRPGDQRAERLGKSGRSVRQRLSGPVR